MPSKFDLLREGQAVEIEPGVSGRLNKDKRKLELSTGEVLDVSNDPDFFPRDERALATSKEREQIQRGIGENPLGEFGYQFSQKGLVGGGKDWIDYLTQAPDNYLARKQAQQQVSEKISEESPWTSRAATAASFIPDIALTRGMSALKAAPLLTLGSAGSRLATDTGEVLGEAALAAGGGFVLDKGVGWLGKVAKRRGESRALPGQQAEVRAQNIAGKQAVEEANLAAKQEYNVLRERAQNENAARLHQHNLTLNERQNRMIQAQNSFEQAKANREAEVFRLKNEYETAKATRGADAARLENEYKAAKSAAEQETRRLNDEFKIAQKHYQESLQDVPRLQKEAQAEYSRNVVKNVADIEKSFPKDSRIMTDQIGARTFIDEAINSTGLAGSREGAQAGRILKSLFPEGEMLTAKELGKRYHAIEDAIQRSPPEVQKILSDFKQHLGKQLPIIVEDTVAHAKIMPSLGRKLEKDIVSIINEIPLGKGEAGIRKKLIDTANLNLKQTIREIGPRNFIEKLESGELARDLRSKILTSEDFLTDATFADIARLRKSGMLEYAQKAVNDQHNFFVNEIGKRIENTLARNEIKAMEAGREASKKLGKTVKKTYGLAEPIPEPLAPSAPEPIGMPAPPQEIPPLAPPQFPGPLTPPETPGMPLKPTMMAEPTSPIPQSFSAQPEPTLAPASNIAESTGDFLEKKLLGEGKGLVNNPLTKLAGLKYLFGKAAIPAEAAYLGMKGLTSPTAAGEVARMTFKQGGIQAIESWAQKYPSYHDGILDNPQERRSLTREIEDDFEIPIEQKALIQSKINRGKPLASPIQ